MLTLGIKTERKKHIDIASINFLLISDQIVSLVAIAVEGVAKEKAPYDTGALMASILSGKVGTAHWKVATALFYAIYQEFGTSKMQGKPFMRPAANQISRELKQIGISVIKSNLR